jgi:hypothetical protein
MAKTKRRSCKGRRRSRRRSGGVPKRGYNDPYYEDKKGRKPQPASHIAERYSLNPFSGIFKKLTPDPRTVDRALLAMEMAPSRTQKALGRFGSAAANRLSSLGASAFRSIGLHSGHLDRSKLQTVPSDRKKNYTMREGAADKLYYVAPDGKLYTSSHPQGPVGHLSDMTDEMTASFLPGHQPTESQTWMIMK